MGYILGGSNNQEFSNLLLKYICEMVIFVACSIPSGTTDNAVTQEGNFDSFTSVKKKKNIEKNRRSCPAPWSIGQGSFTKNLALCTIVQGRY